MQKGTMEIKNKNTILFAPIGTSDPVRDAYDGPMLHIVRHYKPNKVYLFFTKSMLEIEQGDQRFTKAIKLLDEHIQIECISTNIEDPSNIESFIDTYRKILQDIHNKNPQSLIITNNTSGTPQMLIALALDTLKLPFFVKSIQVKTPKKASNANVQHLQQNKAMLPSEIDDILEINLDAEDDAENRCIELGLSLERKHQLENSLKALIEQYDYYGALHLLQSPGYKDLVNVQDLFPTLQLVKELLEYAVLRSTLHTLDAARKLQKMQEPQLSRNLQLNQSIDENKILKIVAELFMVMHIDCSQNRGSEFLLKLSPLMKELSTYYIECWSGLDFDKFTCKKGHRLLYDKDAISKLDGGSLYTFLMNPSNEKRKGTFFNQCDISLSKNNQILEYYVNKDSSLHSVFNLFQIIRSIEEKGRNRIAHEITAMDAKGLLDDYYQQKKDNGLSNNFVEHSLDERQKLMFNLIEDIRYLIIQSINIPKSQCKNIYDIINTYLFKLL